jgi:hypothetical protein
VGNDEVILLTSGLHSLRGIIELHKNGLFTVVLMKKRRYMPKHSEGNIVKEYFDDKEVSTSDA